MKLLFFLHTTKMDGSTISLRTLLRGLREKDVECHVIHPDREVHPVFAETVLPMIKGTYYAPLHMYCHKAPEEGIKQSLPDALKSFVKSRGLYGRYMKYKDEKAVADIVKAVQPDLIHTNVGIVHAGFHIAQKTGIPHVWHVREYQTKDMHWVIEPSFDGYVAKLSDSHVVTITKDLLAYFRQTENPGAQCIYNGCFSEPLADIVFPKEKMFFCCSRIAPEKCYEEVIGAFASVCDADPEYRLVIAGEGKEEYVKSLHLLAARKGCAERIEWAGFRKDVPAIMKRARALIVASRYEGFGRMTAEAFACGTLVIGRRTGGTKELLELAGGLLYDGGARELADGMKQAMEMPEADYRERVLATRKTAREHFSDAHYIDQVYRLYCNVLEKQKDKAS